MHREEIKKLIDQGLSTREIGEKLNLSTSGMRYRLLKAGLKTQYDYKRRRSSKIWDIEKSKLTNIVENANSLAEILRALGYKHHLNSGLYTPLKKRLKLENINFSHIQLGFSSNKNRTFERVTKSQLLEDLKARKRLPNSRKKKIIKFNIVPHQNCAECGQGRLWNKKELILQIDHIDGDPLNNNPENLRFLCPNCHSQTETFCIQNIKHSPETPTQDARKKQAKNEYFCSCGMKKSKKGKRCRKCAMKIVNEKTRKFEISKEDMIKLVCEDKVPFTTLGNQFGVSDNAIRKRCKGMGINPKTRTII